MGEMVTIPKAEYDKLLEDSAKITALENAGVDNWRGISSAHELMEEMEVYNVKN